MKKQAKKLKLAKETVRSLDLRNVAGQEFDPNYTMVRECTFSTIAIMPGGDTK